MIVERQRLLIREANYLRAPVGLPPVRAVVKGKGEAKGMGTCNGRVKVEVKDQGRKLPCRG